MPAILLAFIIKTWEESTICYQRMDIAIMLIFLIGPHLCIAILRVYLAKPAYEFEASTILWTVYLINRFEDPELCLYST